MSSPIQGSLPKDRLGVFAVLVVVLSATAPLTIVAALITTGYATTQIVGLPFGLAVLTAVVALFSVGYVAMSRHVTYRGAPHAYVARGIGRPLGLGTAWMALLAYNALQIGLYGIIGEALAPILDRFFGIQTDWWIIAIFAWVLVAIAGVLGLNINGTVLAVLFFAEIAILVLFDLVFVTGPAQGGVTLDALAPSNLFVPGFGAVFVLAVVGLAGFESAVVLTDESRNPRRTISLATYLSVAVIGAVLVGSAWAMSVATGADNIAAAATENRIDTIFALASDRVHASIADIGSLLFVTSILAAMISFHHRIARYAFGLGRERVFPRLLNATGRRTGAPIAGSLGQSALAIVVIILSASYNQDPVKRLFYGLEAAGGFGLLLLLTLTSISVFAFFVRTAQEAPNAQASRESAFRRVIAPLLSTVALAVAVCLAIADFPTLLGVAENDPSGWLIPLAFPGLGLLGVAWAQVLRTVKPGVYQSIGLGTDGLTGIDAIASIPTQNRGRSVPYTPQHGLSSVSGDRSE